MAHDSRRRNGRTAQARRGLTSATHSSTTLTFRMNVITLPTGIDDSCRQSRGHFPTDPVGHGVSTCWQPLGMVTVPRQFPPLGNARGVHRCAATERSADRGR